MSQSATGKEATRKPGGGQLATSRSSLDSVSSRPPQAGWNDIRVRPFANSDIEQTLNFLFGDMVDPQLFQAVSLSRYRDADECRRVLQDAVAVPTKFPILSVEVKGRWIGIHLLDNLSGGGAEFQAVFWRSEDRGKGYGTISWFKACQYFFTHLALEKLNFVVPLNNPMAKGIIKKLPLERRTEEGFESYAPVSSVSAAVYTLQRKEFNDMTSLNENDL